MAMKLSCVVLVLVIMGVSAQFENTAVRVVLRVYDECSRASEFTPCLKKKAITFMDRLSRMDRITVTEGLTVVKADDSPAMQPPVSDDDIEKNLPRSLEDRDAALDKMLLDKAVSYISSRTLQVTLPETAGMSLSRSLEEGRGHKMKKMMGMMMMGMAAKMAGLVPLAIAGLFLMAGKALLISKIALLLAGIIALKKLVAAKSGGGGGHGGGWQSGGHGGGWQSSSSGGGWDKRSYEAQKMAYKAQLPSQ